MGRVLIVNADDFGWSKEVNTGIVEAHRQGVVTSTTLMATMPGAEDAIQLARNCPDLGVGIHLTLSAGIPASGENRVRDILAPGGALAGSVVKLLARARLSRKWRSAAEAELSAQVEWVMERGVKPDHLDSHKHIHAIRPFPDMVARVAQRYGIRLIRNVCEQERVRVGRVGTAACVRRRLLLFWGRHARRVFEKAGLTQPETLFGVEDTGKPSLERLRSFLERTGADRVEWMVHPGNREDKPAAPTRLLESRVAEKNLLKMPEVRDMIRRSGFRLVRYEELLT